VKRLPLLIAIVLILSLITLLPLNAAEPRLGRSSSVGPVAIDLIGIDGAINPASAEFIDSAIDKAAKDGAAALVIEIDTPGGLLTSMRRIVKALLNSPVPVIVYVAPSGASAASAGTFITEAANIAAMAPGTTIGAAHPVGLEGGEEEEGPMAAKIENFTASLARTIAHQRGRNEAWVEEAVRKSSSISETEALKDHVIDIVAPDLHSLLQQASGRRITVAGGRSVQLEIADATVRRQSMRPGEVFMNHLADPNLMYILMIAGLLGLYFEFAHPGVFFPGAAGAICFLLALASFQVIPINLTGLLLIFLGVALLISEVFLTSYGILGIAGVVAFVIGSLLLINTSETNLVVDRSIIVGAAAAMSFIILGVGYIAFRERRERATTGREGLIGEVGIVREAIAPGTPGRIFVHGEIWRAASTSPVSAGAPARVSAVRGLELLVVPVEERTVGGWEGKR
jgi:membrane-bound serine protease (ClpP class)